MVAGRRPARHRDVALLRVAIAGDGPDVRESVGGSPILVKDGKRWFTDPGDNFTNGRHPRTMVGWTPGGDTLLVTVDGRQPEVSVGMSLFEATDFLLGLGATEGMNLDGGGSTTFVQGGRVVNSVSDVQVRAGGRTDGPPHAPRRATPLVGRIERPVASALVVVPSIAVSVPPVDPLAGVDLGLREQALALPGSSAASPWVSASAAKGGAGSTPSTLALADPASSPDGRLPALVGPRPEGRRAADAGGRDPRRAGPAPAWPAGPWPSAAVAGLRRLRLRRSEARVRLRSRSAVIIDIDLPGNEPAVDLVEPEDCKRFHLAVRGGDDEALASALAAQGVGRLLPSGEAMIDTAAVRRLAAGRVADGWDDDFAAMLKYAGSKGWLDETGGSIQAHVERAG